MSAHAHAVSSHEAFSHDSLDSLGYDWERVGDPGIAPRFPTKVYLPRTTEHIVAAVRECQTLKQSLRIRSKGHSSNNLVLDEDGAVLCTEKLNQILQIDPVGLTARVQSGVVLADLDLELAGRGLGLPVIGDHNHITAGGFAAVGGISPGSHRFGLFVDNVLEIEHVDWDGSVRRYTREADAAMLRRILTGTGRRGVIATLLLRLIRINKWGTLVRNRRFMTRSLDTFVARSRSLIESPGDVLYERGVWLDLPIMGRTLTVGQFSSYWPARRTWHTRFRRWVAYGYLHFLGRIAGRLPGAIDLFVKYLGIIGIIFSPRYATIKDVEAFTDKVLDSSVGDPTRMFVVLAPVEAYDSLFRAAYKLCIEYRTRTRSFTFISFYVKAIESEYLKPANGSGKYAELMLYLGVRPEVFTPKEVDLFVKSLDELVLQHGGLRYMHTMTVKDPEKRRRLDPNAFHGDIESPVTPPLQAAATG